MTSAKVEQQSFLGNPGEVLGSVLAYIEEVKGMLESEVVRGLGFGLIFYRVNSGEGEVVVFKSDQALHRLDSVEPYPPAVFAEDAPSWHRSFDILRDWKCVQPSSIIYGWKNKLAFVFSHSMAIPILPADGRSSEPEGVGECHVFTSISPGVLPFILIDGAVSASRSNTLCMLQAAPEEGLLYSPLKGRVEHEQNIKPHYVRAMLKSRRPAVLVKAFKYLRQMNCPEDLVEAAIEACHANFPAQNDSLFEVMQKTLSAGSALSSRCGRFPEKLAAAMQGR